MSLALSPGDLHDAALLRRAAPPNLLPLSACGFDSGGSDGDDDGLGVGLVSTPAATPTPPQSAARRFAAPSPRAVDFEPFVPPAGASEAAVALGCACASLRH